ncbi:MAG: T9SS type A sorting domain-containing protein [Saprospiraceae bacterium]
MKKFLINICLVFCICLNFIDAQPLGNVLEPISVHAGSHELSNADLFKKNSVISFYQVADDHFMTRKEQKGAEVYAASSFPGPLDLVFDERVLPAFLKGKNFEMNSSGQCFELNTLKYNMENSVTYGVIIKKLSCLRESEVIYLSSDQWEQQNLSYDADALNGVNPRFAAKNDMGLESKSLALSAGSEEAWQIKKVDALVCPVNCICTLNGDSQMIVDDGSVCWTYILDRSEGGWLIYPNPTHGSAILKSESPFQAITIYNSIGALVYSQTSMQVFQLDLPRLPLGVYQVNLSISNELSTKVFAVINN